MSGASIALSGAFQARYETPSTREPQWVKVTLIALALSFFAFFLLLPLGTVFAEALRKGLAAYLEALKEPDAWSAIRLTLITAAIAVAP